MRNSSPLFGPVIPICSDKGILWWSLFVTPLEEENQSKLLWTVSHKTLLLLLLCGVVWCGVRKPLIVNTNQNRNQTNKMVHYLTSTLFPCLVMLTRTGMLFHGVASFGWNPTITSTKISHRVPIRSSQLEMVTFPMFETQERDGPRTTKRMMPTRPKPTSYQGLDGIHHLFTAEHHKYVYTYMLACLLACF